MISRENIDGMGIKVKMAVEYQVDIIVFRILAS
jgi:hypothetical protein